MLSVQLFPECILFVMLSVQLFAERILFVMLSVQLFAERIEARQIKIVPRTYYLPKNNEL